MADGWIKMRAGLLQHPKVVAIARALQNDDAFRAWATPGGGSDQKGQTLSNGVLRNVTVGALLSVWSEARAHGEFVGTDLVLRHNHVEDLDQMSGVPGIGLAMCSVGWAARKMGVTLPGFKAYNVPFTAAERVQKHREREREKRDREHGNHVTDCNAMLRRNPVLEPETELAGKTGKAIGPTADSGLAGWLESIGVEDPSRGRILTAGCTAALAASEWSECGTARQPVRALVGRLNKKLGIGRKATTKDALTAIRTRLNGAHP